MRTKTRLEPLLVCCWAARWGGLVGTTSGLPVRMSRALYGLPSWNTHRVLSPRHFALPLSTMTRAPEDNSRTETSRVRASSATATGSIAPYHPINAKASENWCDAHTCSLGCCAVAAGEYLQNFRGAGSVLHCDCWDSTKVQLCKLASDAAIIWCPRCSGRRITGSLSRITTAYPIDVTCDTLSNIFLTSIRFCFEQFVAKIPCMGVDDDHALSDMHCLPLHHHLQQRSPQTCT